MALDPTTLTIISGPHALGHKGLVNKHDQGIVWVIPLVGNRGWAVLAKRTLSPGNMEIITKEFEAAFEKAMQCLP